LLESKDKEKWEVNMKKRLVTLLLALVMVFSFASCGQKAETPSPSSTSNEVSVADYSSWPEKDITVIVQTKAGSSGDNLLRQIQMALDGKLNGHSIRIENIIDSTGVVPWSRVRDAEPDGYTLAMLSPMIVNSDVINNADLKWNEMTYLAGMGDDPQYLICKANQPYNTVEELVEYAKDHEVKVACSGSNGQDLVVWLVLKQLTGIDFTLVTYPTGSERVVALLGDFVDICTLEYGDVSAQIEAGELKIIASAASTRAVGLPDVPTLVESGYDVAVDRPRGIAGPAGMDPALAKRIEEVFAQAFEDEGYMNYLAQMNINPVFQNGEEFAASYGNVAELLTKYLDLMK